LHLDQYGFPRESVFDASGRPYDFPTDFPSFIDEARSSIQQPDRDVGVIFNAVENWPIEQVAATTQDAVYIEVWPPFVGYEHLQSLIRNAQRLAPSKQVIIAAYMKPLGETTEATQETAEAATLFTSAAIWANGGFHLLMGEQDAALHDPYYVTHTVMRPAFARTMRAYYDFVVRYMNVLSDRRLAPLLSESSRDATVAIEGQHVTTEATAGAIWAVERAMPGYLTVSLINLLDAPSTEWNAPAELPVALTDLTTRLRLTHPQAVRGVYAATPDDGIGEMVALSHSTKKIADDVVELTFETPSLHYWTLLVVELEQSQRQHEEGNA
jgi:dextranase